MNNKLIINLDILNEIFKFKHYNTEYNITVKLR